MVKGRLNRAVVTATSYAWAGLAQGRGQFGPAAHVGVPLQEGLERQSNYGPLCKRVPELV